MTQISRPFQIALVAIVLLGAVWFFALRGHSASTGGSGSSTPSSSAPAQSPAPATSAAAQPNAAGAPTPVYHGSAPGVEGLTRAIAKAHEAVAASQQGAKQVEHQSVGSSASSSPGTPATVPSTSAPSATSVSKPSTASPRTVTGRPVAGHKGPPTGASITDPNRVPAKQALVERELKQGAVVAVLFWNRKSVVDTLVHDELQLLLAVHHGIRPIRNVPMVHRLLTAVGLELGSKFAVQEASASQVAQFGSITHSVQVYQTPTVLIINKHGQTTTLTGLTDAFAIQQAIEEARHS
jgi:hypothetical protein